MTWSVAVLPARRASSHPLSLRRARPPRPRPPSRVARAPRPPPPPQAFAKPLVDPEARPHRPPIEEPGGLVHIPRLRDEPEIPRGGEAGEQLAGGAALIGSPHGRG